MKDLAFGALVGILALIVGLEVFSLYWWLFILTIIIAHNYLTD